MKYDSIDRKVTYTPLTLDRHSVKGFHIRIARNRDLSMVDKVLAFRDFFPGMGLQDARDLIVKLQG